MEKEQVLADFKALQERLAVLNDRLTRDRATRAEYDLCIQATEAAYTRLVGTSQDPGASCVAGSWILERPRCSMQAAALSTTHARDGDLMTGGEK